MPASHAPQAREEETASTAAPEEEAPIPSENQGKDKSLAAGPTEGRKRVFHDNFETLDPNIWMTGGKPSSDGGQWSMALWVPDGYAEHDPFEIVDTGLRIRAKHMPPPWKDPRGWATKPEQNWISGHMSTARGDGSILAGFKNGYFEMRAKMPKGAGTWPAFWLMNEKSILEGGLPNHTGSHEIDIVEGYGHNPAGFMFVQHAWPPSVNGEIDMSKARHNDFNTTSLFTSIGMTDISKEFHNYGADVTETEIILYFDRKEIHRVPRLSNRDERFFMIVDLAMSADWPIVVPPEGFYDLHVEYVSVYQ